MKIKTINRIVYSVFFVGVAWITGISLSINPGLVIMLWPWGLFCIYLGAILSRFGDVK